MSKKQKLYKRILEKPKDFRFNELVKVIQDCGYTLDNVNGSHYIYIHQDLQTLTIPNKTPVKSYLIDQVLDIVRNELEELL